MMRREAIIAAVLALATATPAHGALETVLQDDANLIHRPHEQVDASMAQIAALGVDRVRLTANWSALTRDTPRFDARDPAAYEQARWRGLDQAVTLALAHGLNPSIDIGYWAPSWASSAREPERARTNIDPGAFADFAVAIARRYDGTFVPEDDGALPEPSPDQSFLEQLLGRPDTPLPPPPREPLGRVDQFALWNEPNHQALLMPQWRHGRPASPGVYRRMLLAAYPAAKAVRPDATFLVGNTASMGAEGEGGVAPLRFLRTLACAGCPQVPGDGWAHHPYTRNEPPDVSGPGPDDVYLADLGRRSRTLRRLAAAGRVAPGLRNIHINEFGYETRKIGSRPHIPPRRQARWLTWAEHVADRTPGVVSFAQFLLRDQPPAPVRVSASRNRPFGQYYTGLLTAEGRPKPAASSFVAGLDAERRSRGRVLLWGRLRLAPGPVTVTVERRRPGGPWQRRFTVEADGRSTFQRVDVAPPGTRYRLRRPDGATGLPVAPRP